MELRDLAGEHKLTGVDFENEKIDDGYGSLENSQVVRFRLNGKTYKVIEDPEDGYRSSMKEITVDPNGKITNRFKAVPVTAYYMKSSGGSYTESCDILRLISKNTGKTILEVGTNNTDDYYPYFVSEFMPENI